MALNSLEQLLSEADRIKFNEQMEGKCLNQPNTPMVSGSRRILFSTQFDQKLSILNPEPPLLQTGYENQFGQMSSSFKVVDSELQILKKIYKFSFNKDIYYLIIKNTDTNEIGVIQPVRYNHTTESYGYYNDGTYLDSLEEGSGIIPEGTVYMKSTSFDDYNNRQDGLNLNCLHLAADKTKEDGILIREHAANKLGTPFFKPVQIVINDNDIPVNIYGDDNIHKCIPDIGEYSKAGLLCAIRRERKEESLYTQSAHMLKQIIMSDEKYTVGGKVIDINIACNNPERLNNMYMEQLKMYYDEKQNFANEIVKFVGGYVRSGYKLSHDLEILYSTCKGILNGVQYIKDDKLFSNIIIEVVLSTTIPLHEGDKITDRYGGKGVISKVVPDYLMPRLDNGEIVDIIYNQSTPVNRGNPAQLAEVSINFCSKRILEYIEQKVFDASEYVSMYIDYMKTLSSNLGDYLENVLSSMTDEDMMLYLSTMSDMGGIYISLEPASEVINLDKLDEIYKKFPFIKPYTLMSPIVNSNGEVRYCEAIRKVVCGKKYIYRLKQYAEDKFSVTSLSPTNIRNENCRSRTSKEYKAPYSKTPIRFGNMEIGDLGHIGMETVISNLMIYSISPKARRACEEMLTGDPFSINIRLGDDASNRSVEILNAYLKAMGYKLEFIKRPKGSGTPLYITPITMYPTEPNPINPAKPIQFCDKFAINFVEDKELVEMATQRILDEQNGIKRPITIYPIEFIPVDPNKML